MSLAPVVPGLHVGAIEDAQAFPGLVISCLNAWDVRGRRDALWVPIVAADPRRPDLPTQALPQQLDLVAEVIDRTLPTCQVLVHCREGRERAPLAVAWYLVHRRGMSWEAAYALLRSVRSIVEDRRRWLPCCASL